MSCNGLYLANLLGVITYMASLAAKAGAKTDFSSFPLIHKRPSFNQESLLKIYAARSHSH